WARPSCSSNQSASSARAPSPTGIFPAIGSSSPSLPCPLLVQRRVAMPATAHFRAVRQNRVANPRVLAAAPADHHHVRDVDSRFFLHDPALDVLRGVGTSVTLDDADVLDHHGVFLRFDRKPSPALAVVFP